MKIEKIKNYNQKLLAVFGSILVIIAFVGLIMMIVAGISELRWMIDSNESDTGILSDEKIEELQKENKRQQVISYDFPRLLDTINSIYIIPVRHQTLNSAEFIDEEVLGLLNSNAKVKTDSRYSSYYYGSFNNLIISDLKNNTTKKLFDTRVNFGAIRTEVFDDDILILFTAASKDTYKDGVVNLSDLKSLYIYSIKNKELRVISNNGTDIAHYGFMLNSKDIMLRLGIDYNKDGHYDDESEPSVVKRYDFKTDKMVEIVPKNLDIELQKLLEGSK
ncbi:hypothetical protein [Winogradskyella helgolandensis]|uniref:hypothetical protein n=1 Tax=Winogradskyella helgolandensis TaxID=2697010 RepID=UPI0015BF87D5|nr:hypothetical protein [Winogradskyella helgolandensis]